jgi:hypothetical protein
MADSCSFFNGLDTTLLEILKVIVHFLELVGRVTFPIRDLADDAKWIPGTVRLGRISGKSLIRQVWIIFNGPCRFHDIDPPMPLANGQLGSPDGRIQRGSQVNESRLFP